MVKILSGKITVFISQDALKLKRKEVLNYKLSDHKLGLSDLLIKNFSFVSNRKCLCRKTRELIKRFKNISDKDLAPFENELGRILKKLNSQNVTIEASGIGGFIALRALQLNSLNSIKNFDLNLNDVPFLLLPNKWFSKKKQWKKVKIQHEISKDSWLSEKHELYTTHQKHPFQVKQTKVVANKKAV